MVKFDEVPQAPPDPILGLNTAFNHCSAPDKVNLGVGAYRDNCGLPVVFKAVQEAETELMNDLINGKANKEYLGSSGHQGFVNECRKITLGSSAPRFTSCQAIGGTGALKLGFEYAKVAINGFDSDFPRLNTKEDTKQYTVWVSNPTWPNHYNVAYDCGFSVSEYAYFDDATLSVDENALVVDLEAKIRENDVVLLHAIGHNPTGADPSSGTFRKIFALIESRGAICMLDIAYQGFVSGSLKDDLINVTTAIEEFPNMPLIICQSFSKNMGMYGERLGAVHLGSPDEFMAKPVLSQLELIVRRIYSNPPRHPGDIGHRVLATKFPQWTAELEEVSGRIIEMRSELKRRLDNLCPSTNWDHIVKQRGMFAYTGLRPNEVERLKIEDSIFMAKSGRISIAGLNSNNVDKVASAIARVRNAKM